MKTISVRTKSKDNDTLIFVENINYIRERKSTEVYINFGNDNGVIAQISMSEIIELITEL